MKIASFVTSIGFVVLSACSSATPSNGGNGGTPPPSTNDVTGKACNSDGECGAGYTCEPSAAPTCTPDRACTAFECRGICLGMGEIDYMTGEPNAACMDDCQANGQCCSGDGPSGPGKCARKPGVDPGTDAGGPAPIAIEWKGTWNATVEYDVSCDWGGNVKKGHNKHTVTIKIEGANDSLTGYPTTPTSGWDPLTGTGSGSGATLSGEFPFRDDTGNDVGSTENSTTLRLTTVNSTSSASGSIEGKGQGRFGAKCTISAGTVELAR